MKCGVRNLVSTAYMTLLGTSCYWAVRTWFSKHQVYIVNVSVARAEIACTKLLIDYQEAVSHAKIWPFNEKRGKSRVMIGCRGMTFTLKRIGEFWQDRAETAGNKLSIDYRKAVLHGKIWPFNKKEEYLRLWQDLAKCRLIIVFMRSIGLFLAFSLF